MKREKLLKEVWIVNGGKDLRIQDEENIQHFTTSVFRFVNSLFLSVFFFSVNIKKEPENSKSSRFVAFSFKATYVEIEQTRISEKL